MDLRDFFKQSWVIYAALAVARATPRPVGYKLSQLAANRISRNQSPVYRQLKANISHIPGTDDAPGKLNNLTRQAIENAGRYYYDFYHVIGRPLNVLRKRIHIPEQVFEQIRAVQQSGRGVQLAGIHMGNFDLGMITLGGQVPGLQTLSAANPNPGYEVQNKLRSRYGFEISPISPAALKRAIQKLKNQGVVAVGLDFPNPEETILTEVFGKPAYVPLGTARLALLSDAVTFIVGFYSDQQGHNQVYMSDPIGVIRTGDKEKDIQANTAAYMRVFEDYVSRHPDQWMMFHPFWVDEHN